MSWRCTGEKRYGSTILNLGTRCRWVVNYILLPLYPWGNSPWYPLYRRLGGEEKNLLPIPETSHPAHSSVTILTELSWLPIAPMYIQNSIQVLKTNGRRQLQWFEYIFTVLLQNKYLLYLNKFLYLPSKSKSAEVRLGYTNLIMLLLCLWTSELEINSTHSIQKKLLKYLKLLSIKYRRTPLWWSLRLQNWKVITKYNVP
jgi:hypothetical protein